MLTNIFSARDRKFLKLVKLGDSLGRSLRENVELFSIENDNVTYVTESDKVIQGTYSFDDGVVLNNITINSADLFRNEKLFTDLADSKANAFVRNLFENNYPSAKDSFTSLLGSWELRLKFNKIKEKLEEKTARFASSTKIMGTPDFEKLLGLTPNLVEFLKENAKAISLVDEIKNAVKLANTVSEAFDFEKISYADLTEMGNYTSKNGVNESIYELICAQELIKKELLESKKSFDKIWATNDNIVQLGSMVYEDSDQKVLLKLGEAIKDVPYLALATKKQLNDVFTNAIGLNESVSISAGDIRSFVSRIFEAKKPVRKELIKTLNEKYGINIQNLKEPPTFKNLLNTQTVIFESLSKLIKGDSALKDALKNTGSMLKEKTGVESIDVNNYLNEVFKEAELTELILEAHPLMDVLDLGALSKKFQDLSRVFDALSDQPGGMAPQAGGVDPTQGQMSQAPQTPFSTNNPNQQAPQGGEDMYPSDETLPPVSPEDAEETGVPAMDPEAAAMAAKQEVETAPEEPGADMMGSEGEGAEEPEEELEGTPMIDQDELTVQLKELEALIADLGQSLGGEDSGEGFPEEEEEEGMEQGLSQEEEPTEEEGSEPESPEEEDLADERPPKDKITQGDVVAKKKNKNNNPFK